MNEKLLAMHTGETPPQDDYEIKQLAVEIGDTLVKQDITRDFTLCYWNEQLKDGAQSLHSTAEYVMKAIRRVEYFAHEWKWNEKTKTWTHEPLTTDERERIKHIAKRTYDTYMNRIKLLAILNRNTDNNPLLKWILEVDKEKKKDATVDETIKEKIKKMFAGEKQDE